MTMPSFVFSGECGRGRRRCGSPRAISAEQRGEGLFHHQVDAASRSRHLLLHVHVPEKSFNAGRRRLRGSGWTGRRQSGPGIKFVSQWNAHGKIIQDFYFARLFDPFWSILKDLNDRLKNFNFYNIYVQYSKAKIEIQ